MILLDTNICVYLLKARPASVVARFSQYHAGELAVSVVTAMELRVGALRARNPRRAVEVRGLLSKLRIFPLGDEVVEPFAQVKVALQRTGQLIGPLDLLIAAQALSLGATLVTNNEREFRRVPGLVVDNWV
jgi:tRNA(fMet)-specific endonuclease VapC